MLGVIALCQNKSTVEALCSNLGSVAALNNEMKSRRSEPEGAGEADVASSFEPEGAGEAVVSLWTHRWHG